MNELNLKNIKKIFSFTRSFDIGPKFSWIVLFIFFILLNIIVIIFSIYLYTQISRGSFFEVVEDSGIETEIIRLNKTDLTKIIFSFDKKFKKFDELKKQKPLYVIDPSL